MLNIGTRHQAQAITPGNTIETVWGERIEAFEVTVEFATVTFNPGYRQVVLGSEDTVTVIGHFNPIG